MHKRPEPSSIPNVVLAGVGLLFVGTIGILGGLFYSLRPHKAVVAEVQQAPVESKSNPISADDIKMIVAIQDQATSSKMEAARPFEATPVVSVATNSDVAPVVASAAPADVKSERVAAVEKPAAVETAPVASTNSIPEKPSASLDEVLRAKAASGPAVAAGSKDMNEMVPELKGPSYTAKKAQANGGDAYAVNKPPAKKPEVKKVVPPVPPPAAKQPDAAKPPVYVLKDGRRLRAISVKEDGMSITVKTDAGASVTFKKTDVKEIVRG